MSLQYAKEAIVLAALKDVEEDQKHLQEINLQSSGVWKAKSLALTQQLADCLLANTKLTALNLTDCGLNDQALTKLSEVLGHNHSLFHLNLSLNKFGRPGLLDLGRALPSNSGLISLELSGIRVNGEVCAAFLEAFEKNYTLCKLVWDPEISGYNLKFTEMLNRNSEIDRCVTHIRLIPSLAPPSSPAPEIDRCVTHTCLLPFLAPPSSPASEIDRCGTHTCLIPSLTHAPHSAPASEIDRWDPHMPYVLSLCPSLWMTALSLSL